tara:strand:+ start:766 stop:1146 length:381 start_codon:yes stop_codon:yes gene_type:complete
MAFTDYLENKLVAHTFSNTAFTSPSSVFVALYTVAPTDSTTGTEVSGGGYARQSASFTTTGNAATNASAIEYPTATGNYGTVVAVAILDASSSGNMLAYATLSASKTISTGDVFRIPAGDLDITLD